jgi:putative DNA primase/helicase
MKDVIQEFESAMNDHGLRCLDGIIADGRLHRFTPPGDKSGSDAAWYVFHSDFPPSGAFGSWKSGLNVKWTTDSKEPLTWEQKETLKKRMAADKKRKQAQEKELHSEAKRKAKEIWDLSFPLPADHPYLLKKKILGHSAKLYKDMIAVPVQIDAEIVGLQFIHPTGEKVILTGTPQKGAYFTFGPLAGSKIVLCEGFATGATIYEATGLSTVIAFHAGNLEHVGRGLRERLPNCEIIIAADDDRLTEKPIKNPGIHYATKAAALIRAEKRRPIFMDGFLGNPTDFNDLAILYGNGEVKIQIETGKPSFEEKRNDLSIPESIIWDKLPDQPPGKKPLSTITNLSEILRRAGIIVRYNVIRKEQEILIPNQSSSIDNKAEVDVARVIDLCARFRMPFSQVDQYLTFLSDMNPYNPVAEWVMSRPWDGISRLDDLYKTVKAKNELIDKDVMFLKTTLIRRWFVSAIAAAFRPQGVSAQGILVFQGAQYIGKTNWFKQLAPADLELWAEGKTLNPSDKDSVKQVICYWLVELGELDATFKKAEVSQLKAFVTKDRDMLRAAYAKRESRFVRRTVFFGSVNEKEFLVDPTGNRRYWTIQVEDVISNHGLDMQQIWAEAYDLFRQGESWYLTKEEDALLKRYNEDFQMVDPVEEKITFKYDWDLKDIDRRGVWKTATQVLEEIGVDRPTRADRNRAAAVIRTLNGDRAKRTGEGRFLLIGPERLIPNAQSSLDQTWRKF